MRPIHIINWLFRYIRHRIHSGILVVIVININLALGIQMISQPSNLNMYTLLNTQWDATEILVFIMYNGYVRWTCVWNIRTHFLRWLLLNLVTHRRGRGCTTHSHTDKGTVYFRVCVENAARSWVCTTCCSALDVCMNNNLYQKGAFCHPQNTLDKLQKTPTSNMQWYYNKQLKVLTKYITLLQSALKSLTPI